MALYPECCQQFLITKETVKNSNHIHSALLPTPILPQYASDPPELHDLGGFIAASVTHATERTEAQ